MSVGSSDPWRCGVPSRLGGFVMRGHDNDCTGIVGWWCSAVVSVTPCDPGKCKVLARSKSQFRLPGASYQVRNGARGHTSEDTGNKMNASKHAGQPRYYSLTISAILAPTGAPSVSV